MNSKLDDMYKPNEVIVEIMICVIYVLFLDLYIQVLGHFPIYFEDIVFENMKYEKGTA